VSGGRVMVAMAACAIAAAMLASCEPYRVEYHKRPGYFQKASENKLPDEIVLDDGTRVVYDSRRPAGEWGQEEVSDSDAKPFEIREDQDDGEVTLRAMMPEHVVANTITCLRNQEYDLLWDQMVAQRTKDNYADAGLTAEDFASFCVENRRDLMEALMRIMVGMVHQDVVVTNAAPGVIRCRLRARVAQNFRFTMVEVTAEGMGMKLLIIR
jgi:hypothetical protein